MELGPPVKTFADYHQPNDRAGVVYYTDNRCEERIAQVCRDNLAVIRDAKKMHLVCVSQWPVREFGLPIVMRLPRNSVSMFTQILAGVRACKQEIVYLVEHDVLYHPSHFDFIPPEREKFYYDRNRWQVCARTGKALFRLTKCTSLCVAYRETMLKHFESLLALIDERGYSRRKMGFAPGTHRIAGLRHCGTGHYMAEWPSIDIRHSNNFTPNRWRKEEFRSHNVTAGWKESDSVPGWGKTKGRFDDWLFETANYLLVT